MDYGANTSIVPRFLDLVLHITLSALASGDLGYIGLSSLECLAAASPLACHRLYVSGAAMN